MKDESRKGCIENRVWGSFEILDMGENFKVKRLSIKPWKATSLQYHLYRDEYWRVVKGKLSAVCEGRELEIVKNNGVFVQKKIQNKTNEELVLIEIQYGNYLGEDDIVRLEDDFGRAS